MDATAQATLVRRGEVSAEELVEAAIRTIETLNPALNAVVATMYAEARAGLRTGLPDAAPFTGVPFLVKDLRAACAGTPMTSGSRFLRGFVPDYDSEFVARAKRAGLTVLGKTSTPELGIQPTTEPRLFGACRNPWDRGRSPGGSSGGSAAAVASGMVPVAHANDGGGSIRIPASCCGLFGLKPTRGRTTLAPDDDVGGLVAEHAVTRSVRDSAALLDAVSGPAPGDPYFAPPPERPFLQEVGADPGVLRVAFSAVAPPGGPLHEDCAAAAREAAALCADLGHEVEETAPEFDAGAVTRAFEVIWAAGAAAGVDGAALLLGRRPEPDELEPLTWALYERGRSTSAPEHLLAVATLRRAARGVAAFFTRYDVWLTPTLAEPPAPLGAFDTPEDPLRGFERGSEYTPFAAVCNVTGQPAMSVPLYWNEVGLPFGVHFAGRYGDEGTLFRLAAQLEEARPWAGRRPPDAAV